VEKWVRHRTTNRISDENGSEVRSQTHFSAAFCGLLWETTKNLHGNEMTEQSPDHELAFTELLARYDETLAGGAESAFTKCVRAEASGTDSIHHVHFQKLCDCLELLEWDRCQQRDISSDTLDLGRFGQTWRVDAAE